MMTMQRLPCPQANCKGLEAGRLPHASARRQCTNKVQHTQARLGKVWLLPTRLLLLLLARRAEMQGPHARRRVLMLSGGAARS